MRAWMTAALLAGCGPAAPSVTIVSPADGDVVCGAPLVVQLEVVGIELVDPFAGVVDPEAGHVDLTLNGQDAAMAGAERVEIPDVDDGLYRLGAELSDASHAPVPSAVPDEVTITVDAAACGG